MVNSFFFHTGLKPKEGEYTSRPWEWPINIRVCVCFQVQIKNSKFFKNPNPWNFFFGRPG